MPICVKKIVICKDGYIWILSLDPDSRNFYFRTKILLFKPFPQIVVCLVTHEHPLVVYAIFVISQVQGEASGGYTGRVGNVFIYCQGMVFSMELASLGGNERGLMI